MHYRSCIWCDLPGVEYEASSFSTPYLILLRMGFTLRLGLSPLPGGLLNHHFTLTTYEDGLQKVAVYFLWHFPSLSMWQKASCFNNRTSCSSESGLSSLSNDRATDCLWHSEIKVHWRSVIHQVSLSVKIQHPSAITAQGDFVSLFAVVQQLWRNLHEATATGKIV